MPSSHDSHIDEARSEPQKVTKDRTDDYAGSRKEEEVLTKNATQLPEPEAEHEQLEERTAQERRLGDDLDSAKGKWRCVVLNHIDGLKKPDVLVFFSASPLRALCSASRDRCLSLSYLSRFRSLFIISNSLIHCYCSCFLRLSSISFILCSYASLHIPAISLFLGGG